MSQRMISDVCTVEFFTAMSSDFPPASNIASYISEHCDELAEYCIANYRTLPVLNNLPETNLNKLVSARYGRSLERIALAMYQIYNPLHNTDVEEQETNTGKDEHKYGGSDDSSVINSSQSTNYHQSKNNSLTSGSTYDDTAVANMKPISKTEHELETHQGVTGSASSKIEFGKTLEMDYGRQITKTKAGNIGVMPTQNLLQLEYYMRLRLTLFDAIIRACVNTLGCGVWSEE